MHKKKVSTTHPVTRERIEHEVDVCDTLEEMLEKYGEATVLRYVNSMGEQRARFELYNHWKDQSGR